MAGLSDASSNRRSRGRFTMPGDLHHCHDFQAFRAWLLGLFKNNVTLPHCLSRQTGANLCL
jgi:hypothetical protein